jgi:hypothetical protein
LYFVPSGIIFSLGNGYYLKELNGNETMGGGGLPLAAMPACLTSRFNLTDSTAARNHDFMKVYNNVQ